MKKFLFSIVFATLCFSAAHAQQFGDWEVVCWDSSGVTVPLQVRVSTANSTGALIRTFYRFTPGALTKVVPTVGTISACGNSQLQQVIVNLQTNLVDNDTLIAQIQNLINIQNQITVNLDSLLGLVDSVAGNTHEPQICNCLYSIDLQNHSATVGQNAKQVVWTYDRVVTRNCGAGPEEISRQPDFSLSNKTYHSASATSLTTGSAVLDSMEVHVVNPTDSFVIYLSPHAVKLNYPGLTIDTSHLRYNSAAPNNMKNAITSVIQYAALQYSLDNNLPYPQLDFEVIMSTNQVRILFYIVNDPIGPYINIRNNTYFLRYHRTASGSLITNTVVGVLSVQGFSTETYTTPCGLNASVTYTTTLISPLDVTPYIDSLALSLPITAAKGAQTDRTCTEACPEDDGCIEICNSSANPVPVQIIESESDCMVSNTVEIPLNLTAQSSTLAGNYYHSITVSVTSGSVTISAVNPSGITSGTFASGKTFTATARECELIPTSFIINATSGAATVATIR